MNALIILVIMAVIAYALFRLVRWTQTQRYWRGETPFAEPITFLNAGMGIRPSVLGHRVPEGYRYACAFFGVGLIDRTGTLDSGFPVKVLDPIPQDFSDIAPIKELVTKRAKALIAEARERGIKLRLLWSGGIDSTCVAVALLIELNDDLDTLEIAYTKESRDEYPLFHDLLVERGVKMVLVKTAFEALTASALNVTGEHGDQVFGSMLAADIAAADLRQPWTEVIPKVIDTKIEAKGRKAMLAWMEPQLKAAPVPIETAFEWLWWANFSMKWQAVSERMVAPVGDKARARIAPMMRHFFQTDDFQRWALANPDQKIRETWSSYKWPLKDIIYTFTQDPVYRDTKEKERSLRLVLNRSRVRREAVALTAAGVLLFQPLDTSLLAAAGDITLEWGIGE